MTKPTIHFSIVILFLLMVGILLTTQVSAWQVTNGIAICTVANNQELPSLASDGAGGAFIVWNDERNGSTWNIYAQRVNSSGSTLWTLDGIAICTAANKTSPNIEPNAVIVSDRPTIISDGSGGAVITWEDKRNGSNYDIYAQRVDSTGSTLWTTNGVPICTAANYQYYPTLVSDGSGGAIITWEDLRNGSNYGVYAQRVDSTGSTLWTTNGITICTAAYSQYSPSLMSDGSGGAIITWYGAQTSSPMNISAQRVDSTGSTLWTTNGVAICANGYSQYAPTLVSDGSGGAIITWYGASSSSPQNIYAQRVNSTGSTLWITNGVAICPTAYSQNAPSLVSDSSGGAIITWQDERVVATQNIYAQRVNSTGSTLWNPNGVAICTASSYQYIPTIVGDGSGGGILTWYDYRNGSTYNIYAQRVDSTGSTLWTTNGVAICTAANNQEYPMIISDESGGAIITWEDDRNGNFDIYAQRVNDSGSVPVKDWYLYEGDR